MSRISPLALPLVLSLLASCSSEKVQEKGVVDTSTPPGQPGGLGKADALAALLPLDVQSPHPYGNDMNEEYTIDLSGVVPHCASEVRLRFDALQLEENYDFIHVVDAFGNIVESGTGNHDGELSEWLALGENERSVSVVLETDYSVTRHGFHIDGVEWVGAPICPLFVPSCATGEVDINPLPLPCECPALPTCVALEDLEANHSTGGGFTGAVTGTRFVGTKAITFASQFSGPIEETEIGSINADAIGAFMRAAAQSGLLYGPSVSQPSNWNESFYVRAGSVDSSYVRPAGSYPDADAEVIARYDALFTCGDNGALSCANEFACVDGACTAQAACVCPEVFAPVCGINGQSYDHSCLAECVGIAVKHEGKCGIPGDTCAGKMGLPCQPDHKCRFSESQYEAPFPDASGLCVQDGYCDAANDCSALPHIAIPGVWACESNNCSWQAGSPWIAMDWSMESSHPYTNDASAWKQLYAPDGAQSVRLQINGEFSLESGYDFLEVWSWNGQEWFREVRFTGQEAAGASYEFGGRYHYLHFVSDYSVSQHGFSLGASYSANPI